MMGGCVRYGNRLFVVSQSKPILEPIHGCPYRTTGQVGFDIVIFLIIFILKILKYNIFCKRISARRD